MLGLSPLGSQPIGAADLDQFLQNNTDRACFATIMMIFRDAKTTPPDLPTIDACMKWLYRGKTFLPPE
jgi:hypothetical protein